MDAAQEAQLNQDLGALKKGQEDLTASLDRLREDFKGHLATHPQGYSGNPSHNSFRMPHISRGAAAGGAGWLSAAGLGIYALIERLS